MVALGRWEGRQADRIARAVASGRIVHVTHGDCLDGMSCVGLVRRAFPGTEWIGIQPDETPRAVRWLADAVAQAPAAPRARVLVTDLSLGGPGADVALGLLPGIAARADVVWLDHHDPQWPAPLSEAVLATGIHLQVDRTGTECGATMTLAFLEGLAEHPVGGFRLDGPSPFADEDRAAMAAVAHRDTFSDPDDPYGIRLGLASRRLRADFPTLVEHGEYRALDLLAEGPWRRRERDLRDALARVEERDGVAVVFGPAPLSDLAHAYWPDHPEARLLLHFTPDGKLRIRSRPGFPHAQMLASLHGGGGHAHAAGARLVSRPWRARVYRALGRLDPKVRRVLREARNIAEAAVSDPSPRRGGGGRSVQPTRVAS